MLFVFLAACGGAQIVSHPTTGSIAGLARDHDSGDPIAKAEIRIYTSRDAKSFLASSNDDGLYDVNKLAPGRYTLSAQFAGQPIDVTNIIVRPGEVTLVDLPFTLGRPSPIVIDFEGPKLGAIDRYRPKHLSTAVAMIEGTVTDTATRLRVSGAVVTAVFGRDASSTHQTVSDDHGRYRFEGMHPGEYTVSAYYSVGDRGTIEVRRSGIDVAGAEAVIVPLWIEMQR